jgi:hypothetical protein
VAVGGSSRGDRSKSAVRYSRPLRESRSRRNRRMRRGRSETAGPRPVRLPRLRDLVGALRWPREREREGGPAWRDGAPASREAAGNPGETPLLAECAALPATPTTRQARKPQSVGRSITSSSFTGQASRAPCLLRLGAHRCAGGQAWLRRRRSTPQQRQARGGGKRQADAASPPDHERHIPCALSDRSRFVRSGTPHQPSPDGERPMAVEEGN